MTPYEDAELVGMIAQAARRALMQLDVELRAMHAGAVADRSGAADDLETALGMQPQTFTAIEVDGMLAQYAAGIREHTPEAYRLLWGVTAAFCLLRVARDESRCSNASAT